MEIICYIVILMGNFVFCVIVFERYIVICYLMRKFNKYVVCKIMIFFMIVICVFLFFFLIIFIVIGNGVDFYEVYVGIYC